MQAAGSPPQGSHPGLRVHPQGPSRCSEQRAELVAQPTSSILNSCPWGPGQGWDLASWWPVAPPDPGPGTWPGKFGAEKLLWRPQAWAEVPSPGPSCGRCPPTHPAHAAALPWPPSSATCLTPRERPPARRHSWLRIHPCSPRPGGKSQCGCRSLQPSRQPGNCSKPVGVAQNRWAGEGRSPRPTLTAAAPTAPGCSKAANHSPVKK